MCQIVADFGTLHLFGFELSLQLFGYGLMMVLGFVAAILLARRRARRSGENPDHISAAALWALLGGIVGARLFYVVNYWPSFADSQNLPADILNVTSGGLVYFGGLFGGAAAVIVYILLRKLPLRRYMDIIAPSLMLGLAFGRAGCLLNGCCWGGAATDTWPMAMHFPMVSRPVISLSDGPYSPASGLSPIYAHAYYQGLVTPDARLVNRFSMQQPGDAGSQLRPAPLPPHALYPALTTDPFLPLQADEDTLRDALAGLTGADGLIVRRQWQQRLDRVRAGQAPSMPLAGCEIWDEAIAFDAPAGSLGPDGKLSQAEFLAYRQARLAWLGEAFDADRNGHLDDAERAAARDWLQADRFAILAAQRSHPVRPAQILGIINALLLCGLLLAYHRHRRIEGRTLALMMILYPISRFVLESVRHDDALNVLHGDLTVSQITSILLLAGGLLFWWALGRGTPSAGPAEADRPAGARPEREKPART